MSTTTDRAVPSLLAMAIATAIVAGVSGFFLGQASSIGVFSGKRATLQQSEHSDESSEEEMEEGPDEEFLVQPQELNEFSANASEECKLVLVVRTDLGMGKGKVGAQCGHATLACYKAVQRSQPRLLRQWERLGQAKVALQVKSEEDMELLQAQAISLGICAQVVHDAGRTQIAAGSATVLGVGPAPKSKVDVVTGHLKLL